MKKQADSLIARIDKLNLKVRPLLIGAGYPKNKVNRIINAKIAALRAEALKTID